MTMTLNDWVEIVVERALTGADGVEVSRSIRKVLEDLISSTREDEYARIFGVMREETGHYSNDPACETDVSPRQLVLVFVNAVRSKLERKG